MKTRHLRMRKKCGFLFLVLGEGTSTIECVRRIHPQPTTCNVRTGLDKVIVRLYYNINADSYFSQNFLCHNVIIYIIILKIHQTNHNFGFKQYRI